MKDSLDDDLHENLGFVIDGANKMQRMVEALYAYSTLNAERFVSDKVDLNVVVEKLKNLEFKDELESNGGIISVPEQLPSLQADPEMVYRLMQNLIANGLKYRRESTRPEITIRFSRQEGDVIRIEVEDNGIGIREDHYGKVFAIFKRLDPGLRGEEGLGFGLALCRKIVELHGGEIGVTSTYGQGSTFWFTMPALETPATEAGITASLTA